MASVTLEIELAVEWGIKSPFPTAVRAAPSRFCPPTARIGAEQVVVHMESGLPLKFLADIQSGNSQAARQIGHLAFTETLAHSAVDLKRVACLIVRLPREQR